MTSPDRQPSRTTRLRARSPAGRAMPDPASSAPFCPGREPRSRRTRRPGEGRGRLRRREEEGRGEACRPHEGRARLRPRLDRLHSAERRCPDDRAGRAHVPALRGASEPRAGERVAAPPGPQVLSRGADPPADEGNPEAHEGGPAQQGGDGSPRAAGEARAPPQPAAGRGPRLPDEAGAAAADARDARPARADHQGRTARADLVALGRGATG